MKILYSSTFLSLILAIFVFMGAKGYPIDIPGNADNYSFSGVQELNSSDADLSYDKIKIEVFETFKCKDCMNFALGSLKTLREKYKDDEKVEIQVFTVPDKDDEGQAAAAIGVLCAEEQGKYQEMYEALHVTDEPLTSREIDLMGQSMGLEILPFRNCLKSEKYGATIGENIAYAEGKGIKRKPAIVIGNYVLYGNQPVENIEKIIDKIINS